MPEYDRDADDIPSAEQVRAGAVALCNVAGMHFDMKEDWDWLEYNIPIIFKAMMAKK